ncbi:hypothetical protein ACET3Z_031037 [Daucus carota]
MLIHFVLNPSTGQTIGFVVLTEEGASARTEQNEDKNEPNLRPKRGIEVRCRLLLAVKESDREERQGSRVYPSMRLVKLANGCLAVHLYAVLASFETVGWGVVYFGNIVVTHKST